MTPRAQALARTLISRMRQFEGADPARTERSDREWQQQREKLVEKVLFSELGLTDFAKAQLIAMAMPRVRAGQETADRDLRELATFLHAHVNWAEAT